MCKFLSGITFGPKLEKRFGAHVICHRPSTYDPNSHSAMEKELKLPARNDYEWAKWEYTPKADLLDFDNYSFRLDEQRKPDWFDEKHEKSAIRKAKSYLNGLIERDEQGRITHYGLDLLITADTKEDFSQLESVGGYLYIDANGTLDAPHLEKVNGKPYKPAKAVKA